MRGIHQSLVNSPHKVYWHRALMFSLISVWTNGWVNNRDVGNLRCNRTNYDVIVMMLFIINKNTKPDIKQIFCFFLSNFSVCFMSLNTYMISDISAILKRNELNYIPFLHPNPWILTLFDHHRKGDDFHHIKQAHYMITCPHQGISGAMTFLYF